MATKTIERKGYERTIMDKPKLEKTQRGFGIMKFIDKYGVECSIQESSLATEAAIWIGCDDANPKILANQACKLGVKTNVMNGWIPFPIPEEVSLDTRMHLTQDMVKTLLPILKHFAKTGCLK